MSVYSRWPDAPEIADRGGDARLLVHHGIHLRNAGRYRVTFRKDVTLTDVPSTNVMVEFDPAYLHFINASLGGSLIANCTLQEAGGIMCLFGVQDADFSFDVHDTALVVTESTATYATLFADFDGASPDADVTASPATDDVHHRCRGHRAAAARRWQHGDARGRDCPIDAGGLVVLLGDGVGALRRIRLS
jgi:hypothetical protein